MTAGYLSVNAIYFGTNGALIEPMALAQCHLLWRRTL